MNVNELFGIYMEEKNLCRLNGYKGRDNERAIFLFNIICGK
jgi:hypothetical protein